MSIVAISNTPRDYAWGSHSAIAEYLGTEASGRPEAELWLGAHPGSPARLVDAAGAPDLAAYIAEDPEHALGRYADSGSLPFLLKVLAADSPLSLQAHPNGEQARAGFDRENADGVPLDAYDRNYRDPFHKPELIVAVSDTFDALCGFRPIEEIRGIVEVLRAADAASEAPDAGAVALLADHLAGDDPLHTTVEWLLRDGRGGDTGQVRWVVERVALLAASDTALASPHSPAFATVTDLARVYPGDPGIVISLLLNRVTLRRGEALSLPAGNIHAYLHGLGIELMAASDNVLRGGLTPKHIDVTELLEVLDFRPTSVPYLAPEATSPGVETFRPDVPDFLLHRVDVGPDAATVPIDGPAIVLVAGGDVRVAGATSDAAVPAGTAVFVTPDEAELRVEGYGVAWVATTGNAE
ncbi:mannose-6-phosphate isomerase, class I [Agromyces archimandritae]|uniref:mannose-6-phosphate isomerase n=1 Tax=Agromyces archimandritae TaxID=2781962 RepID=A0A975FQB3_9MICO|nr:mannose-6-phosphate isomerase, class I [Agromyces archimandritae]QTX05251.1 mannose-6-phosphate isomerase, class I [Agromyces archimandritae]